MHWAYESVIGLMRGNYLGEGDQACQEVAEHTQQYHLILVARPRVAQGDEQRLHGCGKPEQSKLISYHNHYCLNYITAIIKVSK